MKKEIHSPLLNMPSMKAKQEKEERIKKIEDIKNCFLANIEYIKELVNKYNLAVKAFFDAIDKVEAWNEKNEGKIGYKEANEKYYNRFMELSKEYENLECLIKNHEFYKEMRENKIIKHVDCRFEINLEQLQEMSKNTITDINKEIEELKPKKTKFL